MPLTFECEAHLDAIWEKVYNQTVMHQIIGDCANHFGDKFINIEYYFFPPSLPVEECIA